MLGWVDLEHCRNMFKNLRLTNLSVMLICNVLLPKANPDSVQQRSTAYSYSVTYNHLLNFPQNRLYKNDNSPVIISTKVMNKLTTIG